MDYVLNQLLAPIIVGALVGIVGSFMGPYIAKKRMRGAEKFRTYSLIVEKMSLLLKGLEGSVSLNADMNLECPIQSRVEIEDYKELRNSLSRAILIANSKLERKISLLLDAVTHPIVSVTFKGELPWENVVLTIADSLTKKVEQDLSQQGYVVSNSVIARLRSEDIQDLIMSIAAKGWGEDEITHRSSLLAWASESTDCIRRIWKETQPLLKSELR